MSASQDTTTAARRALVELVSGSMSAQVVGAFVKLGVADALDGADHSAEEAAAACRPPADAMRRLLRAASTLELVADEGADRFALTPTGAMLRTGQGSLNAFEQAFGAEFFDHLGTEPVLAAASDTAMSQGTHVVAPVPGEAEVLVLKSVLHDWEDLRATTILRDRREVLPEHGRLLAVEPVPPDAVQDAVSPVVHLSDLNALVNLGGRERTQVEFDALPGGSGVAVTDVIPLPPPGFSLVEAVPA